MPTTWQPFATKPCDISSSNIRSCSKKTLTTMSIFSNDTAEHRADSTQTIQHNNYKNGPVFIARRDGEGAAFVAELVSLRVELIPDGLPGVSDALFAVKLCFTGRPHLNLSRLRRRSEISGIAAKVISRYGKAKLFRK